MKACLCKKKPPAHHPPKREEGYSSDEADTAYKKSESRIYVDEKPSSHKASRKEDGRARTRKEKSSEDDTDRDEDEKQCSESDEECERERHMFSLISKSYIWYPSKNFPDNKEYVHKLERDHEKLQQAFFELTTHFARVQFRLRQVLNASPRERGVLLADLEKVAYGRFDDPKRPDDEELPSLNRDFRAMGQIRRHQRLIINQLRSQLTTLQEASDANELEILDPNMKMDEDGHVKYTEEQYKAERCFGEEELEGEGSQERLSPMDYILLTHQKRASSVSKDTSKHSLGAQSEQSQKSN